MTLTWSLSMLVLIGCSIVAIVSKVLFLAPTRWGVAVMLANVVYETLFKRIGWDRWPIDAATAFGLTLAWWAVAGWLPALLFLLIFSLAWGYALNQNIRMLNLSPGSQDTRMGRGAVDRRRAEGWVPVPNPHLVLVLRGPVWERGPVYDLGDWPLGHTVTYEFLVLNPTVLRASFPLVIDIEGGHGNVEIEQDYKATWLAPKPGEIVRGNFTLKATKVSNDPVDLTLCIAVGGYAVKETLRIRSIFETAGRCVQSAEINRWKGGTRAGFAWRGDMDMYDPTTFQSVEGLRHTLELCLRWRVASTMYLSGRLSLVKSEHEKFCEHLGVDRDTPGIDRFIRFMKEEVSIAPILDFPYETDRRYALELGNHMYLHYHTHAAMDEANDWKNMAWMEDGRYFWQTEETGSFAEQRDNAMHNAKVIRETLGGTVCSWGVPGRGFDKETARAVEASGIEVGSDTDASMWINVMELPAPHHPKGTKHLVEMTKKYPGDPDNAYKVAMLKYWIGLARRTRRAFVFMAHQHLLRYEGVAGTQAVEEILRHVLADCRGDLYVTTVYGLGWYWERVLCPQHRWVSVSICGGRVIEVKNKGNERLDEVPVEVTFDDGKHLLLLVSINAGETVEVDLFAGNEMEREAA